MNQVIYNGKVLSKDELQFGIDNRALRFGDGLFETMKYDGEKVLFEEDHYFRLMGGMRLLRMEIPMLYTPEFFHEQLEQILEANEFHGSPARLRFSVFRNGSGKYTPESNDVSFWIEATPLEHAEYQLGEGLEVDLFTDHAKMQGSLSNVKSNSCFVSILAGVFAQENQLDDCLIINDKHQLVESISGNIFLIQGKTLITPPLQAGPVKGVMRRYILDQAKAWGYEVKEEVMMPFEIMKSDGVVLCNVIQGLQWVKQYKKKSFDSAAAEALMQALNESLKV